jgi:hypothetical protein
MLDGCLIMPGKVKGELIHRSNLGNCRPSRRRISSEPSQMLACRTRDNAPAKLAGHH